MRTEKKTYKLIFMGLLVFSLLNFGNVNANNIENLNETEISTDCVADFSYEDYEGPMPFLGGITFQNLSTGPYTNFSWDFGDDTYDSQDNTVTHNYGQSGSYLVSLTVWDSTQQCFSTSTAIVQVWISDDPCDQLDCVWPGDTNSDGFANLQDILNIGLAFGATGPPRDSLCGEWHGHPAIDWDESTVDGVNLKHGDCNGDGIINLSDLPFTSNISESYTILENGVSFAESDGPPIKLEFNVDTVNITDVTEPITITAELILGSSYVPIEDVYGMVLYLNFPGQYIDSSSQVNVDYYQYSFFGGLGEVIPRSVDLSEQGQVDIAFTRNNGIGVTGQGRLATVSFIIDADIIDGREEAEGQSFDVSINVVSVIDKFGNELKISLSEEPASVFFINNIITKVMDPVLSERVKVFPNPVTNVLNIDLGELKAQTLELYDILGKRVEYREIEADRMINFNVNKFENGIYLLKIQTDQGIVIKRVVVE